MATTTRMGRKSGSTSLVAGMLLSVGMLASVSASAENPGKIGPTLETVKAFGDDFRLVG